MRAAVNAWIGDVPKLADLFAGVGALSLGRPGRLSLFESDKPSVAAVDAAARKIGGNRVIAERRDLFRNPLGAKELDAFDAVVLDPPRAGAAAQVAEIGALEGAERRLRLVRSRQLRARRARAAGRRVPAGETDAIDQFLWSPHLELIALFARR